MSDDGDIETKEVPLPQDVTLDGGRRTQTAGDQLFMLGAGLTLVGMALSGYLSEGGTAALLMGAFLVGVAFERLNWMLMADYGSWRGVVRHLVGRFA